MPPNYSEQNSPTEEMFIGGYRIPNSMPPLTAAEELRAAVIAEEARRVAAAVGELNSGAAVDFETLPSEEARTNGSAFVRASEVETNIDFNAQTLSQEAVRARERTPQESIAWYGEGVVGLRQQALNTGTLTKDQYTRGA